MLRRLVVWSRTAPRPRGGVPRIAITPTAVAARASAAAVDTLSQRHRALSSGPAAGTADAKSDGASRSGPNAAALSAAAAARPKPNRAALNFDEVKESFANKSDWEIARALVVFRLSTTKALVNNSKSLLDTSYAVLGARVTNTLLRWTFFGHFCAGEDSTGIKPVMEQLQRSGVRSILDYAAEADVPEAKARPRDGIVSARTYDYEGEDACDANVQRFIFCINTAGEREDGFAAIKLTALGRPELLEHLSSILVFTRNLFDQFTHANDAAAAAAAGGPAPAPAAAADAGLVRPAEGPAVVLNAVPDNRTGMQYLSKTISLSEFRAGLKAIGVTSLSDEKVERLFRRIDRDGSGAIDYLEWINFLDPRLLGGLTPRFKSHGLPTLSQDELKQVEAMIKRLELLAEHAARKRVRLMVDAEQTYFQPAIDHMVLYLQRKYNREFPTIYNTYQCYLRDSFSRMCIDMERARRGGFWFAAKAVRGAYMVSERARAAQFGYADPVFGDIEQTHANYHRVVDHMLANLDVADILVATHNENTVRYVTRRMDELQTHTKPGRVFFGQLLGMCDHVSFSLGHAGYAAYKYVPYGPIKEVIPYLIRRAQENSSILADSGIVKERRLLYNELMRRWHKP